MGLIDSLLAAFRGVGQDYKRLATKVDAMPEPVQDTGWRNVTALLQFPQELNGTGVFVRRVGDLCYARIQAPYSYRQSNRTTSRGALPVGLRPHVLIGSVFTNGSGQQIAFFAINTNGQVSGQIFTTGSGGLVPQGLIVYTPSGPFPSELPGSPSNY